MISALVTQPSVALPSVYVLHDRFMKSAHTPADQDCELLAFTPFKQTFEDCYETDAHFVSYCLQQEGQFVEAPRCSKVLLSKVRALGCDILQTMLVLDYDNKAHAGWGNTPQERDTNRGNFLAQLGELADSWPFAWEWNLLYFTKGGARLVYVLNAPCKVEEFEQKHQWVCQEFVRRGMGGSFWDEKKKREERWGFDIRVSDWTRCFRLPYVVREGKDKTWEADYSEMLFQYDNFIDADKIPLAAKVAKSNEYGEVKHYDLEMPDKEEALALIEYMNTEGKLVQTDWFKAAKKQMRGRECFDTLFASKPISGQRNNTIFKYVGECCSLLFYLHGTEPKHLFGLFYEAVEQLDPDAQTSDWFVVLWDAILRLWAQEEAKNIKVTQAAVERIEESQDLFQRIIRGMKSWDKNPVFKSMTDNEALSYAMRRLIVSCGKHYYVMGENGHYDPIQLTDRQLIPYIRAKGLDGVLETKIQQDGGVRDISVSELLNEYSTVVSGISARAEIDGAYVQDMDTPRAMMIVPSYRRSRSLEAEYSDEVDQWLKKFFGKNYEMGIKWISWSLAWDEGTICALSLEGRAGSGKKLLVQGLAECLETPMTAGPEDLTGDYQYGLLYSPFLAINEGWPTRAQSKHPADAFRALVSGDPSMCNQKYMAPIKIRNPVRIVFTANNLDVVKQLSGNRDLSPEDREALSIRLLHLRIDDQASDWLRSKGGTNFTARPGHRWVTGDAGEQSDFVVAKHFLWLHKNRKGPVGSRLLVEGNNDQEIMFDMRTQSGSSPLVMETIIHLLNKKPEPEDVAIHEGRVWVAAAGILSYFRQESVTHYDRLSIKQITAVLRGISKHVPDGGFLLACKEKVGRKRWYEIDCELLLRAAERDGWNTDRLVKIVKEYDERAKGTYTIPPASQSDLAGAKSVGRIIDFSLAARDLSKLPPKMVAGESSSSS